MLALVAIAFGKDMATAAVISLEPIFEETPALLSSTSTKPSINPLLRRRSTASGNKTATTAAGSGNTTNATRKDSAGTATASTTKSINPSASIAENNHKSPQEQGDSDQHVIIHAKSAAAATAAKGGECVNEMRDGRGGARRVFGGRRKFVIRLDILRLFDTVEPTLGWYIQENDGTCQIGEQPLV